MMVSDSAILINTSNAKYFEYFSDHSNGVLQFSKPHMITGEMTDEKFKKLISALFNENEPSDKDEKAISKSYSQTLQNKLISRVKDLVHIDIKISDDHYPGLSFE